MKFARAHVCVYDRINYNMFTTVFEQNIESLSLLLSWDSESFNSWRIDASETYDPILIAELVGILKWASFSLVVSSSWFKM